MRDSNVVEYSMDKFETCDKCGKQKPDVTTRIVKGWQEFEAARLIKWCDLCWDAYVAH